MVIDPTAADAFAVSAALDATSGVLNFLASKNAQTVAKDRADMMRAAAEADAQRYAEQAQSFRAKQKVEFLASGVTLKGSPIDVLDTSARIAGENIAAIRMHGALGAQDEEQAGANAAERGRAALVGGFADATKDFVDMAKFAGYK